ncbi:MAG: hypothetical protein QM740_10150 [Acidovorax sp.]
MTLKPWHIAPVLAVAAVAAAIGWWQMQKDRWSPPPALKPDLPQIEPMPAPAPFTAKQALARPLLWTSRRPSPVDEKKDGMAQEITQSRLTAVLESGRERVAVLQRANGTTLKVTTETAPWRIQSFDGRKAVFVSGSQSVEKPLEAGKQAPPKGGARAGVQPPPKPAP